MAKSELTLSQFRSSAKRGERGRFQRMQDQIQRLVQTLLRIVIPGAQHAEALGTQPGVTLCIVRRFEMLLPSTSTIRRCERQTKSTM